MKKDKIETQGTVINKPIEEVIHSSMIPYTEYVVMDRALPRVEDGLKPVQRRILYSMLELGLTPDKQYRKSARIVGDCMGKYHPHGDSSVYDAMVRMAQDYSMRETLVDGHGNFGSIDGDSPAAMRYTEARLTLLSLELLKDLHKNTVSWSYNFDDTTKEPDMLPGKFPNLLVNGSTGIAVGVATNIPPHNLGEVIDGVCAFIKKPKITISELMKYIKGPDFPTGGLMITNDDLKQAYKTGKGRIILRAKVSIENDSKKNGNYNLVITELPYQVNKSTLLQKIVELREAKKTENTQLAYISDILDESDRNGMRAIIKIKNGGNPNLILEYLYKNTQLESQFNLNMVAIAGGKPKQMGLLEIIAYYVKYQREVLLRKSEFDLKNTLDRKHIVEGLLIAINQIDLIISIIRKSDSVADAKQRIIDEIKLTQIQAQAILEIRLSRLVNLEILKLEQENAELKLRIEELKKLINSQDLQYSHIISELNGVKKHFGNKRRTKIIKIKNETDLNEILTLKSEKQQKENQSKHLKQKNLKQNQSAKKVSQDSQCLIVVTADRRLKRVSNIPLNENKKSSKQISSIFEDDLYRNCLKIANSQNILIFTNFGNCLKVKVSEIPDFQSGVSIHDLYNDISYDEMPIKVLPADLTETQKLYVEDKKNIKDVSNNYTQQVFFHNQVLKNKNYKIENILLFTKFGLVKKMKIIELKVKKQYYKVINLKKHDEVINVQYQADAENLLFITKNAFSLNVKSEAFPILKRIAGGLMAIKLVKDDEVIYASQVKENEGSVTIISKNGYSKNIQIEHFNVMQRYRRGLKTFDFKSDNEFLIYVDYHISPQDIAVKMKQNNKNFEIIKSQLIPNCNRNSKAKRIIKSEFISIIPFKKFL